MLYNADAIEVLETLADGSIDCVITDPPYRTISGGRNDPLSKARWQQPCGILRKNDGKIFDHNDLPFEAWLPEVYRVLKDGGDFYCFSNCLNLFKLQQVATGAGFHLHNVLVWLKNNATPNRWYMKNCEYILYFYKGFARPIEHLGSKTVMEFANVKSPKLHPTQKPVELMKHLVENSTIANGVVLDPFMGVGPVGIACKMSGRDFIGIEIDDKYFDIADKLIKGVDLWTTD